MCVKFEIKTSKKLRGQSVQETAANEFVEIRVETRMKTGIKVKYNMPDIIVHDRRRNEITLIEVGITNQDILQTVEVEKTRKYDLWLRELSRLYKYKTKIIPYVITFDSVVTSYQKNI